MIIGSDDCEKQTSSALREACRNRDASLVDLLIRFGARDDDGQALRLASSNSDFHLMSKTAVPEILCGSGVQDQQKGTRTARLRDWTRLPIQ